ncbi:MAG: nucleoside deaminase [Bacilli bacterium]|nr:nucleoside deaminase [Bacilli bacterium]
MEKRFIMMAIEEAKKALAMGEVPVGAVIVKNGEIIAKAYNKKEKLCCVTQHAEIIAIEKASKKIGNWRLNDCDIYITLEPCPMCASAIKQARISNIYCGLSNSDKNNINIVKSILDKDKINNSCNYYCGYFQFEIKNMMKTFFKNARNRNN